VLGTLAASYCWPRAMAMSVQTDAGTFLKTGWMKWATRRWVRRSLNETIPFAFLFRNENGK
jgi:hypothetical protein